MKSETWLLLLYALPTRRNTARVSLWRKLKSFGAVQLKTSAYLLPDQPANYERFQWLVAQIRESGGDATLIRVGEIEGMSAEEAAVTAFLRLRLGELAKESRTEQRPSGRQIREEMAAPA